MDARTGSKRVIRVFGVLSNALEAIDEGGEDTYGELSEASKAMILRIIAKVILA